ncbi:iron ABC transporter permease [Phytohabitans sp. ZYX-F-186]|uniref:Iron ABC transporter permease n=1 Tax=Phytohabitans maris TaxID=3071409 RepID=A0ABU0ZLY4_9ACTN|nr:iron ABC transporter permease [Phytohabitans sp. ZYX-F-186]MDQ7908054.1 iron ABC transporter permease [Phytohabitans sp. ZYX-F-186]
MSTAAAPRSIDRPSTRDRVATGDLAPAPARTARATAVIAALLVALVVTLLVSAGAGQLHVPPDEVIGSVLHRLGLNAGDLPSHPNGEAALWNIRFPRLMMGLLVGAGLGVAGAVMQGIFGNPLAEPGVIGVSAGAGVGACAVIVFGWAFLGPMTIPAAAFVTALVTTVIVYGLARRGGRTEVVTLVLMGIAVNAVASALIAYFVFLGDTAAREQIVFWQLGSLNGSRWVQVQAVAPLMLVALVAAWTLAGRLDLLALGERAARHLGVHVERLRLTAIVLTTLMVAAGVAFAGIIAFVGLVVPHLIRMAIGPSHRSLLPGSAVGGALVLSLADLVARTAVDYADLPIGMLTALVGGPFFFWLLMRARARAGGWA